MFYRLNDEGNAQIFEDNFEDSKNLYDVEWIENDVNRQKTGLSDSESNDLLCELADRGIIGTKTAR